MKTPVIVACLFIVLALTIALWARRGGAGARPGSATDAALLLLGSTNSATGISFVRFCLSNSTKAQIACLPESFEQLAGGTWARTPVSGMGSSAARNWVGLKEALKPGESMTFLVPPPTNAAPWRLVFMCQERETVIDPLTDTVRHLTGTNAMKTQLRQFSGRRYHVTSPEVEPGSAAPTPRP